MGFYRQNISVGIWQQLSHSPMNLQMDIFGRYYTLTDNFTDGRNPPVFYSACHNDRWMYRQISSVGIPNIHRQFYRRFSSVGMSHYHRRAKSVGIFQAGNFFFWHAISVYKTIGKFFFIFLTDIAMESGITD